MSGGLRASFAMLIALAVCSSQRSNVRLGSLTPSQRSLDTAAAFTAAGVTRIETVHEQPPAH